MVLRTYNAQAVEPDNWFFTGPNTEIRIHALIQLAQEMGGRKSGKTFTAVPTTDMG